MFRSSNPSLNDRMFKSAAQTMTSGEAMTIEGTANKTGILVAIAVVAASYTWKMVTLQDPAVGLWVMGGLIGGFIVAMITVFRPQSAMITAPIYALLEGFALGGISGFFDFQFQGIVIQAALLTFGTLLAMLMAYRSGLIKVTENFRAGVIAATGGILFLYLITFVLGFFGVGVPFIHQGGTLGILISVGIVVVAALNLVLDFDVIETGAKMGAPKYMEWYGAFGLMVTLVWLYLEILRLLSKLRSRD